MPISKDIQQELRRRLEEELKTLNEKLGQLGSETDGPDAAFHDLGDDEASNAEEVAEYQNDLSVESSLEDTKKEVEAALARMEAGTYGICENSGEEIAVERLRALPWARTRVEPNA